MECDITDTSLVVKCSSQAEVEGMEAWLKRMTTATGDATFQNVISAGRIKVVRAEDGAGKD